MKRTYRTALASRIHRMAGLFTLLASLLLPALAIAQNLGGVGDSEWDQYNGEFTYKVPIKVPAYHGIEPKLTLSYRSGQQSGWLGLGWAMEGFSVIERLSKGRAAPRFDSSDIYVLDGIQLLPCQSGTDSPGCKNGGSHFAKYENYKRINWNASNGTWTITSTDGTVSTYGVSVNLDGTGSIWRWVLTGVRDTHGNTVKYAYSAIKGFAYPSKIEYNGTSIEFNREPMRETVGFWLTMGERLKSIEIKTKGRNVRFYRVAYTKGERGCGFSFDCTGGVSLISSIQEHGSDASADANGTITGGTALPSMRFGYTVSSCYSEPCFEPDPDLLSSVSNGYGSTIKARYNLANTVVGIAYKNGNDPIRSDLYRYKGLYYDGIEKRRIGYKEVTRYSNATQSPYDYDNSLPAATYESMRKTTFTQVDGSFARPLRIEHFGKSGNILSAQAFVYSTNSISTPYTTLLTGSWDYAYATTGSAAPACPGTQCKRTYLAMKYDDYGNRTGLFVYGDYDDAGDESLVTTNFKANASAYIVNLPALVRTWAGHGTSNQLRGTQYVYDQPGSGSPQWNAAPSKGDLTQVLRWHKQSDSYVKSEQYYDGYGNVVVAKDELGKATVTTFDDTFHLYPETVKNALGQVIKTSWNTICGLPASVTGFNGEKATNRYDSLCRLARTDSPLGGFVAYSYCATGGNDCGDVTGQYTEVQTPSADGSANVVTRTYFDGFGRTWRVAVAGAAPGGGWALRDTRFDALGRVESRTDPYGAGEPQRTTKYLYDGLNRVIQIIRPDGKSRHQSYSLWKTLLTDEAGKVSSSVVDAFGNQVESVDNTKARTTYRYDLIGRLVGISDPSGNAWSYAFDTLDRRTASRDPDLGSWTYGYNAAGRLVEQLDARNQRTAFSYDNLGRPLTEKAGGLATTWEYDQERGGYFNIGRLTSMKDETGSTVYDYDLAGRIEVKTKKIFANSYTFGFAYDGGGRTTRIEYPDGDSLSIRYDRAGRQLAIPGVVSDVEYKAWGAPASLAMANGVLTKYTYDKNNALDAINSVKGSVVLQNLDITSRDAVGRIATISGAASCENWSYAYDDAGRLVSANSNCGSLDQTFRYSAAGNLTYNSNAGTGNYAYPAQGEGSVRPHAVTNAGGVAYTYDANGNMLTRGATKFIWDARNRLVEAGNSQYSYDGEGARVRTKASSGTSFFPDADYEVSLGTGKATKTIRMAGMVVAQRIGTTNQWMHSDHLGSIRLMTDASGKEIQRSRYRSYGERQSVASSAVQSAGYIGERLDAETGLIYQRSRYYDPVLARYTAADLSNPANSNVGTNRYAYAGNDPINSIDDGNSTKGASVADNSPLGFGFENGGLGGGGLGGGGFGGGRSGFSTGETVGVGTGTGLRGAGAGVLDAFSMPESMAIGNLANGVKGFAAAEEIGSYSLTAGAWGLTRNETAYGVFGLLGGKGVVQPGTVLGGTIAGKEVAAMLTGAIARFGAWFSALFGATTMSSDGPLAPGWSEINDHADAIRGPGFDSDRGISPNGIGQGSPTPGGPYGGGYDSTSAGGSDPGYGDNGYGCTP